MKDFFSKTFEEQVHYAIDNDDAELLQVLLGPEYCKLSKYWLMHAILCHNMIVITKTLNYQLPSNILHEQLKMLKDESSKQSSNAITSQEARNINEQLEGIKTKILHKYKTCNTVSGYSRINVVDITPAYDIKHGEYYFRDVIKLTNYVEKSLFVHEIAEKFKDDLMLKNVIELDFAQNYCYMYEEGLKKISEQYKLSVNQGDNIQELCKESGSSTENLKALRKQDELMNAVVVSISELLTRIHDGRFIREIYDRLLLNVANRTGKNPFSISDLKEIDQKKTDEEKVNEIKRIVRTNDDYNLLKKFLEYAVKEESKIDIINVLLVNSASLMHSYVNNKDGKSITVREYFSSHSNRRYSSMVNKSIFTVMKDVHRALFNSPMIKDNVNLVSIISAIPSVDGSFNNDMKGIYIFNKIGNDGGREFMNLLQNIKDKYIEGKEYSYAKDMLFKRIYVSVSSIFVSRNTKLDEKDYEDAREKLYDSLHVGCLAIITGDAKVIIDYVEEIEHIAECTKNSALKELYSDFSNLLKAYKDLPKKMWINNCMTTYISRTVKSYTWKWDPAWEKVLIVPDYNTEVCECSKTQFEEMEKIERGKEKDKIAQAEQKSEQYKETAEQEKKTAEQERKTAKQYKERAEQYEEALRQAGIDPNTLQGSKGPSGTVDDINIEGYAKQR